MVLLHRTAYQAASVTLWAAAVRYTPSSIVGALRRAESTSVPSLEPPATTEATPSGFPFPPRPAPGTSSRSYAPQGSHDKDNLLVLGFVVIETAVDIHASCSGRQPALTSGSSQRDCGQVPSQGTGCRTWAAATSPDDSGEIQICPGSMYQHLDHEHQDKSAGEENERVPGRLGHVAHVDEQLLRHQVQERDGPERQHLRAYRPTTTAAARSRWNTAPTIPNTSLTSTHKTTNTTTMPNRVRTTRTSLRPIAASR